MENLTPLLTIALPRKYTQLVVCLLLAFYLPREGQAAVFTSQPSASNNWGDAATWVGGVAPGSTIAAGDVVNIVSLVEYNLGSDLEVRGTVNITNGTFRTKLTGTGSGRSVFIRSGGSWLMCNGRFYLPIFSCGYGCSTGASLSGNFINEGGTVNVYNSVVEIAQNWDDTSNPGSGSRIFTGGCLKVGENFSVKGSTDLYDGACIEIGLHGSGNWKNEYRVTFQNGVILKMLGSGNFENVASSPNGVFSGPGAPDIAVLRVTGGNLVSNGVWTASVENFCITGGSVSESPSGSFTSDVTNNNNTTACTAANAASCSSCPTGSCILAVTASVSSPVTCNGATPNNDGAVTVTITPGTSTPSCGPGTGITYSWNTNPVQTTQTATGLAPGVYTVTVTDASGCTATSQVTLSNTCNVCPAITATITGTTAICESGSANLQVAINGGTAPYLVEIDSDGIPATTEIQLINYTSNTNIPVSPTSTTTYTLISVTDAVSCPATLSGSAIITVNQLPAAPSCAGNQSVCVNTLPLNLAPLTSPSGGTFSGTGVSGTSYSAAAGTTNTVTYTVTDANGCTNTCSFTVTVNPQPAAPTCPANQSVCVNELPLNLAALVSPAGGTFSGTGVSGTSYSAAAGTTNTVTYTVTDANNCTNTCSFTVTVNPQPAAPICPANQSVCVNELPLNLAALVSPSGGTFSGTGVSGTSYSAASGTTNTVTYTVTDANGCTNTCSFTVTVNPQPAAPTCAGNQFVCVNTLPLNLTPLASPAGGTFSGTGVSGTSYSAAAGTTNTVTYTITDANNCTNSCSFTVTVNPQPAAPTCPANQSVCVNELPLNLAALVSPSGGTFSGTGVSGTNYSAAAGTTNTVTYTVTDANGCTNTCSFTVTVNSQPAAPTCAGNQFVCVNTLPLNLTPLASPAGGTFSGTGVSGTGVSGTSYSSAAGTTNTVTYTITDANGCTNTCSFTVTVNPQPAAPTCPANQSVCVNELPLNLAALVSPAGGTFSGTGVSGTNYSAAAGTTNTVTYTVTDANGCTNTCSFTVTVNPLPVVNCPLNQLVAVGNLPLNLAALLSPQSGTFSGTGVSGTNYSAVAGTTNTVTFTVTDGNGCSNSCSFDITVAVQAQLTCPSNITVCTNPVTNTAIVNGIAPLIQNAACAYTLTYTLSGATTGGGNDDASGTAFNPGTTTVTYNFSDNCQNQISCSFVVVVRRSPNPYFQPSAINVCDGAAVVLTNYVRDNRNVARRYNFWEGIPNQPGSTFLGTATATNGNVNFGQVVTVVPSGDPNLSVVHTYYVEAINTFASGPNCSAIGGPFTVTVKPTPAPPVVPVNTSVCPGTTVNVPAFSSATPPGVTQFSWSNSNTAIGLGANGVANVNALTAFSFSASANTTGANRVGLITVWATKDNCISPNSDFQIVVRPQPVGVSDAVEICSRQAVNYSLQASPASNFVWVAASNPNVSGESLSPQAGPAITDVLVNTSGQNQTVTYTVTPTSLDGCSGNSFTVVVLVKPEPVLSQPQSITVCSGAGFNYSPVLAPGPGTVSYQRQAVLPGGVYQIAGSTAASGVTAITGAFINVSGSDKTVNYQVTPLTDAPASCEGQAGTVSVVISGVNVQVSNLGRCDEGGGLATFDLTAGSAAGSAYFLESGGNLTAIAAPAAYVAATGTVVLCIPPATSPCSDIQRILLTVNSLPIANITGNADVCLNSSIALNGNPSGGQAPYGHAWSTTGGSGNGTFGPNAQSNPVNFTGTAAGGVTVQYQVTDANGCTATATAALTVKPLPTVMAMAESIVCETQTIDLEGVSPDALSSAIWSGPSNYSFNGLNPPSFPADAHGAGTLTYTLTVVGANGCSASDDAEVEVVVLPYAGVNTHGGQFCVSSNTPISLYDILDAGSPGTPDPNGVWTGQFVAPGNGYLGTIVPSSLPGPGTYNFIYGVTHPFPCNVCIKAVVTIEIVNCVNGIAVWPKVVLEGPYDAGTGLMRDQLRSNGVLPTTEPFSGLGINRVYHMGGESVQPTLLTVTGPDAIVDWVLVELRDANNPVVVIANRAALLQRDGDVVDVNGQAPVVFNGLPAGNYYVSVSHRNHLGVMSAQALALSNNAIVLDFSNPATAVYGVGAQRQLPGNKVGLYSGDADANGQIQNTDAVYLWIPQVGASGYRAADFNLDGQVQNTDAVNFWAPNAGRGTMVPK